MAAERGCQRDKGETRMTPIKIGFVLLSNSQHPIPSTRIAVLNMFPFLRSANFEPHIVFEPADGTETPDVSGLAPRLLAEGFGMVCFQKVHGSSVVQLARQLTAAGVKTVYCVCDLVDVAMAEATDATIVVTDYLKSLYPSTLQPKIHVVHDGIEHPDVHKTNWNRHRGSRSHPLRAVLVTSAVLDRLPIISAPPEWLEVTIVGRYPPLEQSLQRVREARWMFARQRDLRARLAYLRFLANRRIQCLAWDPVDVYDKMRAADIAIIPIDTWPEHEPSKLPPSWKVKSENRLTMKMCVGLPVIATPIPSYEPVIQQGRNGFLAHTPQEWAEYLDALRDPVLRHAVGEQARESVLERYSMQEQARRLLEVLHGLMGSHAAPR
jgi:hypothetical protein